MRTRLAILIAAGSAALGGCAYGYGGGYGSSLGGLSVGIGSGYGGYGGYGYDPFCSGFGYSRFGGFGYGGYGGFGHGGYYGGYPYGYSRYGRYSRLNCLDPFWGWYDGFYYPGTGFYVYDRYRRPFRWSDAHRRYWTERRQKAEQTPGVKIVDQPNWGAFSRERAEARAARVESRNARRTERAGQVQTRSDDRQVKRSTRSSTRSTASQRRADRQRARDARRSSRDD